MAKKTRTRVEEEAETVKKIACDECDERYENRGIRGRQGVNTLALDAAPEENSGRRYSRWRSFSWGNPRHRHSGESHRINSENVIDLCVEPCFEGTFMAEGDHEIDEIDERLHLNIEVEETEYEVVEEEEEVYLCDSCGDEMGNNPDHEVSLNPRLKSVPSPSRARNTKNLETADVCDTVKVFGDKRVLAERDDVFHVCVGCTDELFGWGTADREGFLTRVRQLF